MKARFNLDLNLIRIYYNAVFGAIGGLLSWAAIAWLAPEATGVLQLFVKDAVQGALAGVFIGGLLGAVDGVIVSRQLRRLARGLAVGAGVGLAGGVVGLMLGEAIFILAGGGLVPRAIGWAVFGAAVGMGEGIANRRADKRTYGALGGLLGGLVGGATYEQLSLLLRDLGAGREAALTAGGALGLIILGACIGSLVGLVEDVLRRAGFKALSGPLEGQLLSLPPRRETVLGKADTCSIILPGDPDVQAQHAVVTVAGKDWIIRPRDGPVMTPTGDQWQPVAEHTLAQDDEIRLGRTRLKFRREVE